jgi:ketosteroid isomerase-like protein
VSELDDFRNRFLPRLIEAERTLHQGDIEPRLKLWTRQDPVTLFGAIGMCNIGWEQVGSTFSWLASTFSNFQSYDMEILASDVRGDLAYTVAIERHVTSINNRPVEPHALRVTQIYRREDGDWKVVHRHGNGNITELPTGDQTPKQD